MYLKPSVMATFLVVNVFVGTEQQHVKYLFLIEEFLLPVFDVTKTRSHVIQIDLVNHVQN